MCANINRLRSFLTGFTGFGPGRLALVLCLMVMATPALSQIVTGEDACDKALSFMYGPNEHAKGGLTEEHAAKAKPVCTARLKDDPNDPRLRGALGLISLILNDRAGVEDLKTAARDGVVGAMDLLFSLANEGYLIEGPSNLIDRERIALEWAEMGAEAGDAKLQAQTTEALWFLYPFDPENVADGLRWARASADQGNEDGLYLVATYLIGDAPVSGDRTRTDKQKEEGRLILKSLLENGSLSARYHNATERLLAAKTELQIFSAVQTLEELGELGMDSAFYVLGLSHFTGHPMQKNEKKGIEYICRAGPEIRRNFEATEELEIDCAE